MKKGIVAVLLMSFLFVFMTGCQTNSSDNVKESMSVNEDAENSMLGASETEAVKLGMSENQPIVTATDALDIEMVTLPEGIIGLKAETTPNLALQQLIIEYYEIPLEFHETTRYYYNYVDLNQDGINEIFAIIMGPYTSGTGGSSALWIFENNGKLHVNQDFTLVNPPVIISDAMTNGYKELIVPYYGGGAENQYSVLTCSDSYYSRVADGTMIKTLEGITGTAIIANDLPKEMESEIMGLNLLLNNN